MPIRTLKSGDEPLAEQFLAQYAESSMILRGNIPLNGLEYHDKQYQGNYFASFTDSGVINGILTHYWNGNIIMQAPDEGALDDLIRAFRQSVTRPVAGVIGPDDQAVRVISSLGFSDDQFAHSAPGKLYALDLNEMKVPEKLDPSWRMKLARDAGVETLHTWMKAFEIETLGAEDNDLLNQRIQKRVERMMVEPDFWILEIDGRPVSVNGFNARLPDSVQIGSVYTPPEHRGQGYARSLLTLVLQDAQRNSVQKAVLFTDTPAAAKAYEAIGFNQIGSYRIAILKQPIKLNEELSP
jgi:N-acetylglutamate synthase-like GNAT family acetyltransferase